MPGEWAMTYGSVSSCAQRFHKGEPPESRRVFFCPLRGAPTEISLELAACNRKRILEDSGQTPAKHSPAGQLKRFRRSRKSRELAPPKKKRRSGKWEHRFHVCFAPV